jgi:K+-sensing histidine kinase KdpD
MVAVEGDPSPSTCDRRTARRRCCHRLDRQRELVEELGGTYREVVGADVGETLVATAHTLNATQIVLGATRRSRRKS